MSKRDVTTEVVNADASKRISFVPECFREVVKGVNAGARVFRKTMEGIEAGVDGATEISGLVLSQQKHKLLKDLDAQGVITLPSS